LIAFLILTAHGASAQAALRGPMTTVPGTLAMARADPQPVRPAIVDGTDIRFTRPSTSEELLHTNVFHIAQDDQGFMWFATAFGLYRYDGYNFKVFAPDPRSPDSLSNVEINTVFKDRNGAIWIGCAQFLNRLDPCGRSSGWAAVFRRTAGACSRLNRSSATPSAPHAIR